MKEFVNISDYYADEYSVGEWEGKEKLAASNTNRIYDAVYDAVKYDIDDDDLHDILHRIWDDWGSEESLLSVTDEQINQYVDSVL